MADKRVKIIKHNKASVKFEVDSRYSPLESIGTGAYGVVCAAKDNRTGQRVAIKKIPKVFEVLVIAKRTYRELKILRHLRHENIISILDVMQPPEDLSQFEDVYVVLDLMESDLHHIIHSVQPLSDEHIKFFLYQILRGLKYIHSASVLHRDLKPSNLLVNRNCELKIGDFGMARGLSSTPDTHANFMTEYVATRWYRAPELMLSFSEYTFAIDIWSVGCILAEMLGRRQLFPGKDYLNQLQLILTVVGTPDEEYIRGIGSERVKTYLQNLPARKRVDISVLFPNVSPVVLELLDSMLQLDPKKRITSEDALAHKYLTRYHDPKDEPICTPPFDFGFEKELVTQDDLCRAIVEELMDYHKSRMPIPSQDTVKDALKKMMEDREKEREKVEKEIENGNVVVVKEVRETKEAPAAAGKAKKSKAGSKRRKQTLGSQSELKRVKTEEEEEGLTDKDKCALSRWKEIQQHTRPFIHPIRKLVRPGEVPDAAYMQQQEVVIKQQFGELEMQQKQIMEYERTIKEQSALIATLRERHKAVVSECRAAGVKLPKNLLEECVPKLVNSSHQAPPASSVVSSHSVNPMQAHQQMQQLPRPLPPAPPALAPPPSSSSSSSTSCSVPPASQPSVFSPPMVRQTFPSISPTNRTPPPPPPPPPPGALVGGPPHAHLPPPPLHPRPSGPLVSISSSCNIDTLHSSNSSQFPRLPPQHAVGMPSNHSQFPLNQTQMLVAASHPRHAQGPISQVTSSRQQQQQQQQQQQPFMGAKNLQASPAMLIDDLTFSPLTSGELKELEQPPGYVAPPLVPFSDELDSILNLSMPSGSGAGYGVGVKEEELSHGSLNIDLSNLGPTTSAGPPSASLLRDWLDVSQLDPDDMDVLQRELETGAPDVFNIQDFPDL